MLITLALDNLICDYLRAGSLHAADIAARLRREHPTSLDEVDVVLRLGGMLGSRVAVSVGFWRLLSPAAALPNVARTLRAIEAATAVRYGMRLPPLEL